MNRTSNRDASSRNNQNRQRNRGRNNNNNSGGGGGGNRRGPNPLQRSYESNGPEVKIRGNAMQVAEKYLTLARDAQVAGDRILAENYMQHAEHYSRIIAAAQAATQQQQQAQQAQQEQQGQQNPQSQPNQQNQQNEQAEEQPSVSGSGPQPVVSPGDNIGVAGAPVATQAAQQPSATADNTDAAARNTTDGKPDQPKPARGRRRRPEPVAQPAEEAASDATSDAGQVEVAVEEKPQRKPRTRRPRAAAKPAAEVAEVAEPVQPEAAE